MTSHDYIIMIIVDSCMIWFHFDCIMQLKNHIILLLMVVVGKVLLLLVISLTDYITGIIFILFSSSVQYQLTFSIRCSNCPCVVNTWIRPWGIPGTMDSSLYQQALVITSTIKHEVKWLIHSKFQRFGHWSFGMDKSFHHILYRACDSLFMLKSMLIHVCRTSDMFHCYDGINEGHHHR